MDSSCVSLIVPRLLLLQALSENCFKFPSVGEWPSSCSTFLTVLETTFLTALETIVGGLAMGGGADMDMVALQEYLETWMEKGDVGAHAEDATILFSQAVDKHLVCFLHESTPGLALLVQGYLPRPKQSWLEFLESTLVDAEAREMAGLDGHKIGNPVQRVQLLTTGLLLLKDLQLRCKGLKVEVQLARSPTIIRPTIRASARKRQADTHSHTPKKPKAAARMPFAGMQKAKHTPKKTKAAARMPFAGMMPSAVGKFEEMASAASGDFKLEIAVGDSASTAAAGAPMLDMTLKPPPTVYKKEKVFYATDRKITENCEYTGERALRRGSDIGGLEALHYGFVMVGIPASKHEIGQGGIETPNKNEESDPLSHVVILSVDTTMQSSSSLFIKSLNSDLTQFQDGGSNSADALIYIHGYNTGFKDAMKRAGQLKYDLKLCGAMISYSWSSTGLLYNYFKDGRAAQETVACLANFIKLCITQVQARRVHVLAHSMGNRALIGSLTKLYREKADVKWISKGLEWPLKNVIVAAADEERQCFEEMVELAKENYKSLAKYDDKYRPHFSVYCSQDDMALRLSTVLHFWQDPRLGQTSTHLKRGATTLLEPPKTGCIDVIDATGVGVDHMNHSYYGDVPLVLKDIGCLISSPGDGRAHFRISHGPTSIKKMKYGTKQVYYSFSSRKI